MDVTPLPATRGDRAAARCAHIALMSADLTGQTVELLQAMIRNRCVNDGRPRLASSRATPTPCGRSSARPASTSPLRADAGSRSVVARIEGSDPSAPSLCLMGHTDVVPVSPDGWHHDPFGGELIDGEVWGRGADRHAQPDIVDGGRLPPPRPHGVPAAGDLIYFGVADEESGGTGRRVDVRPPSRGDRRRLLRHRDRRTATVDEHGQRHVTVNIGEKGVAWRKLRFTGTPGHGSMPYGATTRW